MSSLCEAYHIELYVKVEMGESTSIYLYKYLHIFLFYSM